LAVLEAYPVMPAGYQSLTRNSGDRLSDEDEALLQQALVEHRADNRQRIHRWLKGGRRFQSAGGDWQFNLVKTDFNWMLQVLNDVRVGSWLQLGSPNEVHNPVELLHKDPVALFHMEAAGLFEMYFLEAVQESDGRAGED
jgi:hypothetical protein